MLWFIGPTAVLGLHMQAIWQSIYQGYILVRWDLVLQYDKKIPGGEQCKK